MHRALFNLCLNARNAGASLIKIETVLVEGGRTALIVVQDNGNGFPGPTRPSELIWNLPVSADGLHGHGLAIVKKTIDEHNGTVEVWSQPGETIFKIWLPIRACAVGTAVA
jgi:nitrogen-specific signal transduction histidine kinase